VELNALTEERGRSAVDSTQGMKQCPSHRQDHRVDDHHGNRLGLKHKLKKKNSSSPKSERFHSRQVMIDCQKHKILFFEVNSFVTRFGRHYYINTVSHILWTFLLQNCRTDYRHFRQAGALWSDVQHGLCEIAPHGQVWEFLSIS